MSSSIKMVEIRDPEKVKSQIVEGMRSYFKSAGYDRAVLGLSGGLDSSVTLSLTAEALSPRKTTAVLLPSRGTPKQDLEDARELISLVKVPQSNVILTRIDRVVSTIDSSLNGMTKMERANATARVRMIMLHAIAYRKKALVVGTGDRSEIEIGFFTKYGDGGVDVLPIGRLLKTQVRHMASFMGLPQTICDKPSSPRLWPGHLAEKELGVDYETVDEFIHLHLDQGMSVDEASAKMGTPVAVLKALQTRMSVTAHKRALPPTVECDPF